MTPELRAWLADLLDVVEDVDDPIHRIALAARLRGELYRLPLIEPTEEPR